MATHLVLLLVGVTALKNLRLRRFKSDRDEMTDRINFRFDVIQNNGHDVISCRKVLPHGEWKHCICRTHAAVCASSWSIVPEYSYLLKLKTLDCMQLATFVGWCRNKKKCFKLTICSFLLYVLCHSPWIRLTDAGKGSTKIWNYSRPNRRIMYVRHDVCS